MRDDPEKENGSSEDKEREGLAKEHPTLQDEKDCDREGWLEAESRPREGEADIAKEAEGQPTALSMIRETGNELGRCF